MLVTYSWIEKSNVSESFEEFSEHLRQLRMGDKSSVTDFWEKYSPFIRRSMRFRIARASLQPAADSMDVCQSAFGTFLLHLSAGEYELSSEEDLRKLLISIANNKFLMLQRREQAAKRSRNQTKSLSDAPEPVCENSEEMATQLDYEELMAQVSARLSPAELELLRMRREGQSWDEIARHLNEDPRVLCKRFSRALKRVSVEIGLEEKPEGKD